MFEPTQTTLIDLCRAIADRSISAMEVTRAYLDRIDRFNGRLRAYDEIYAERALQRAKMVDAGEITGSLAGAPVAVKNNLCTDFGRTTCGSRMLVDFRAPYTATVVDKLEAAGAIVLGKTAMDEFAMGSSTEHSAFGRCANPWSQDHVPGGSSGGSATAMAADLCAAAIGSDTGGSIRQPAAYCGVVGVKPTYGRVSRFGLVAFASSLDQIGPLTRTVSDAALLLNVIAGQDPRDSTSADVAAPDYLNDINQPITGMRIGLVRQYCLENNHKAVATAMQRAIDLFTATGAEIVEVDLPHAEYGVPVYYLVATAEASSNLARYDGVHYGHRSEHAENLIDLYERSRAEGFGNEVKRRIMLGTYALSSGYYDAYYLRALKVRRLIKQDFDRAFASCDAILCPTCTGPAFKTGELVDDPLAMYLNDVYTVNGNLAGVACMNIPGGVAETDSGVRLPVGVQLLAAPFEEEKMLRLARALESTDQGQPIRPVLS